MKMKFSNLTLQNNLTSQLLGFGNLKNNMNLATIPLSSLNSASVQAQLKKAGIDTNSEQYKAAVKQMMSGVREGEKNGKECYFSITGLKNLMKGYDSHGNYIDPTTGLTGLLVNEKDRAATQKTLIDIPESSREEMFELVKKEFIRENGVYNGDTTKRSDVYTNLYWKMPVDDRLKAGYTMEQYERAYSKACYEAVRASNPNWQIGQSFDTRVLDSVTRESVEARLTKSGNKLTLGSFDCQI